MYLSQLLLDPQQGDAGRDLASPYELHRTLGKVFPGPRATDELKSKDDYELRHGVLFRIEDPGPESVPVIVQSVLKPDWSQLPQSYARRIDGPKSFELSLHEGQSIRFRLVANPVRRVRIEGKKNPRRMPLIHPRSKDGIETGYLDWLERQAARCGFEVAMDSVVDAPFRLGRKRKIQHDPEEIEPIPKSKIGHFGVRFDGVLRVTDPDTLLDAVRRGIGPAKAFGFGLLSLAPA